jgi:Ulp1 family protease
MSMIYGKGKTVVPVKIPNVQQQKNSIDCGVFAIAFMVEFCFNNFIGRDNVNFDTYTMRDHLIKCKLIQNNLSLLLQLLSESKMLP